MEIYKSNSHASKDASNANEAIPAKKEKIIIGNASVKKKNGIGKFVSNFISTESSDIKEVVVSSVKNMILDFITTAFGMKPRRGAGSVLADKLSYRSYYRDPTQTDRFSENGVKREPRVPLDYDNIIVDSKGDAEAVLDQLCDLIREYGKAKVSDFYDLCGLTCDYTCESYGWFDLSNARTVRLRDGRFSFDMPRVEPLK